MGSTAESSPALEQRQTAGEMTTYRNPCATRSDALTSTTIVESPLPAKKAGIEEPGRTLLPMLAMVVAFALLLSDVPWICLGVHDDELLPPVKLVDKGRKLG